MSVPRLRPGAALCQDPEATMAADLYLHVRDSAAPRIVRVYEQGPTRARRGSVRWTLVEAPPGT